MQQMKALLAMYSLRETMQADLTGTLEHAARLGFDGVELAWYAGHSVAEVRRAVRQLGLEVWSCHTDVREMLAGPERNFEDIASLGARYVVICHMRPEERPGGARFEQTREDVARLSELARTQYGLTMLYHNHDFDLQRLPDGRRSLDVSYEAFALRGELDTCWVELCGASTVEYLQRYAGRIPLMHVKDYRRTPAPAGAPAPAPGCEFCPLGWGEIDFAPILSTAQTVGVQAAILEVDEPGCGKSALECVELGAQKLFELMGRTVH